uniref:Uncharacterized protein n=1 Tax=Pipistrellus kuhlii TaxID=59472 RepID=A0A7J7WDP7_PIPKU|nr:hypothetical protein mPipKuh1_008021 [Pipistrellus kuhlii]
MLLLTLLIFSHCSFHHPCFFTSHSPFASFSFNKYFLRTYTRPVSCAMEKTLSGTDDLAILKMISYQASSNFLKWGPDHGPSEIWRAGLYELLIPTVTPRLRSLPKKPGGPDQTPLLAACGPRAVV